MIHFPVCFSASMLTPDSVAFGYFYSLAGQTAKEEVCGNTVCLCAVVCAGLEGVPPAVQANPQWLQVDQAAHSHS